MKPFVKACRGSGVDSAAQSRLVLLAILSMVSSPTGRRSHLTCCAVLRSLNSPYTGAGKMHRLQTSASGRTKATETFKVRTLPRHLRSQKSFLNKHSQAISIHFISSNMRCPGSPAHLVSSNGGTGSFGFVSVPAQFPPTLESLYRYTYVSYICIFYYNIT